MPFDLKNGVGRAQGSELHPPFEVRQPPAPPGSRPDRVRSLLREGGGLLPHRRQGGPLPGPPVRIRRVRPRAEPPNHRRALHEALDADLPNLVQMDCSLLSGVLAEELVARSHPGIERVFFTNSGAEAVESAIKFARAATKRTRILYCDHAFHGLTTGALALNGGREFRSGFGPLLPGCRHDPLRRRPGPGPRAPPRRRGGVRRRADPGQRGEPGAGRVLAGGPVALSPAQGAHGPRRGAGRDGTLGDLLLPRQFGITPDIITVSKALSGGFVPVGRDALLGRRLRRRVQLHGPCRRPLVDLQHQPAGHGGRPGHPRRLRGRGHPRPGPADRQGVHEGARAARREVRVAARDAGPGVDDRPRLR